MGITGNWMIDGDRGQHPSSPYYTGSVSCPSCSRSVSPSASFCRCGMPVDEMGFDEYCEECGNMKDLTGNCPECETLNEDEDEEDES